ncbi:hypothetical protein PD885_01276 [Xanthomonas fragariae]|uniref:Uncharacterized protein n=1 Tax=Xanthomonas fragariae TaxID=48664 RepID=A0ABY1RMP2_9XANT|nr:hypothetical protein PD885_01276 [Xanthomonas fragariae]
MRGFYSYFEHLALGATTAAIRDGREDGTADERARRRHAQCLRFRIALSKAPQRAYMQTARQPWTAARDGDLRYYQRYATDIWYCRPAIGRPMNTPPVAAPGTRILPSVRPSVSVTLLPLAVISQCSPTCRLAPISSMS